MATVPTSPATVRASLTAEIDMAVELSPLAREALTACLVPFAELFCREQARGGPETGRALADATLALAAGIIGHMHMNMSRPGIQKVDAVAGFMKLIEARVLRALVADDVIPPAGARRH